MAMIAIEGLKMSSLLYIAIHDHSTFSLLTFFFFLLFFYYFYFACLLFIIMSNQLIIIFLTFPYLLLSSLAFSHSSFSTLRFFATYCLSSYILFQKFKKNKKIQYFYHKFYFFFFIFPASFLDSFHSFFFPFLYLFLFSFLPASLSSFLALLIFFYILLCIVHCLLIPCHSSSTLSTLFLLLVLFLICNLQIARLMD